MKGILFKPDMIEAIVEGRKTVSRRIAKTKKPLRFVMGKLQVWNQETFEGGSWWDLMPKYQIGDVVYIKEAWHYLNIEENKATPYDFGIEFADGEILWWTDNGNEMNYPLDEKKRSPLFLKAKFARYFIKITDARPERLQEITLEDIYDEGIDVVPSYDRIDAFKRLWDSINPKSKRDTNPWVWRYEFECSQSPMRLEV